MKMISQSLEELFFVLSSKSKQYVIMWIERNFDKKFIILIWQVQEYGIGNGPIKRKDDQDEGDERNESNRVGSNAHQNRIEEQRNPKLA